MPKGDGQFAWRKITDIKISKSWKKSKGSNKDKNSLDADYAVLKLKHPHKLKYFKLKESNDGVGSTIKFNGYPVNKGGIMWHSSCPVEKEKHHGKILLSRCSASTGSSGSGVYQSSGFGEYFVTGVVSASIKFQNGKLLHSYIITNKLTGPKIKRICRWAGIKNC